MLEELIDEKLKMREAKRFSIEGIDNEVDTAFANMARRMRLTARAIHPDARPSPASTPARSKPRIKADITWSRSSAAASRQLPDQREGHSHGAGKPRPDDTVGYDYTLRPILFVVPRGSPDGLIDGRKREAEALRGRFQGCEEGIAFARALRDVAVRAQVMKSSADLPPALRKMLEKHRDRQA